MKSIVGEPANKTRKGTYYTTFVSGYIKPECEVPVCYYTSVTEAWNAFFQQFLQQVEDNKEKDLVWRSFPKEAGYPFVDDLGETRTLFVVRARYCFE